jgi:branched-chain amino acid transport system permease protein
MKASIRKNLVSWVTMVVLVVFFIAAARGMETSDWVITLLRGLSVGAITFLVASGFSLIFGLLDVLNLAHGTLFMIGAYVAWTVYVRPDTFVDLLTPALLLVSGFLLTALWDKLREGIRFEGTLRKLLPWLGLILAVVILGQVLTRYPITIWDPDVYNESPVTFSFMADQGLLVLPEGIPFEDISPAMAAIGLLVGSSLAAFSLNLFKKQTQVSAQLGWRNYILFAVVVVLGLAAMFANDDITSLLTGMDSTWLFLVSVVIAVLFGGLLGGVMESSLIRPLYVRPIYQLMLTIGLSAIGIEVVRAIWGRPEFVMPKPSLFAGTGDGCPATNLSDLLQYHCSTIMVFDGRVRVYNEIFIPIVGIVVLIAVWVLLQRSRLGMIIRAGVQDSEMVEALGINVRQVFTLVFALGVGLAALGGALAAPSMGLSNAMGDSLFLNALIALAIGGLTSYPGAAVGSILVGLLQQVIIKYGAIGIAIPFTNIVFKPTPPLVPASTVLLMVIILLFMPNGLLGRKE